MYFLLILHCHVSLLEGIPSGVFSHPNPHGRVFPASPRFPQLPPKDHHTAESNSGIAWRHWFNEKVLGYQRIANLEQKLHPWVQLTWQAGKSPCSIGNTWIHMMGKFQPVMLVLFWGGSIFLVGSEVSFSEKMCANDYIIPKNDLRGFWAFPLLNYYFWGDLGWGHYNLPRKNWSYKKFGCPILMLLFFSHGHDAKGCKRGIFGTTSVSPKQRHLHRTTRWWKRAFAVELSTKRAGPTTTRTTRTTRIHKFAKNGVAWKSTGSPPLFARCTWLNFPTCMLGQQHPNFLFGDVPGSRRNRVFLKQGPGNCQRKLSFSKGLPPRNLTWIPKMAIFKRNHLFQGPSFWVSIR